MRALALVLVCLTLAACGAASVTLTRPDGTVVTMPPDIYAHEQSVAAYREGGRTARACYAGATTDTGRAICALADQGGGQGAQLPVYRAGPTGWDRALATVQTIAPIGLGILQFVQADRANERAHLQGIRLAEISAGREVAVAGAFRDTAASGFASLEALGSSGHNALVTTATSAFGALERLGDSAIGSAEASTEAWARMVGDLRPTYQAGGDLVLAGGDVDQSTVAGHRVTGEGNEVGTVTLADCTTSVVGAPTTSTAGTAGSATATGGTTGSPGATVPGQAGSTAAPGALTGTTHCTPRGG